MVQLPWSGLNSVIHEATLIDVDLDVSAKTVQLRLGVLLPAEQGAPQPQRTILLRDVSRVAVWLRHLEFTPDATHRWSQPGAVVQVPSDAYPQEMLADLVEFRSALSGWCGWEIYGQSEDVFDLSEPSWTTHASLDVHLAATDRATVHSIDLALDTTPDEPDRMIDMRFEFRDLRLIAMDGTEDDVAAVTDQVRAWWRRMRGGDSHGQYGIVPGRE